MPKKKPTTVRQKVRGFLRSRVNPLLRRAREAIAGKPSTDQSPMILFDRGQEAGEWQKPSADEWLETGRWATGFSSNVGRIRYDFDRETLFVEFHGGSVYAYYSVPAAIAKGMYNAPSLGKWVWRKLRDKYAYTRIH